MGYISIWHWLIVLLVICIMFGTKKLRNLGEDLGAGIKGFKEGLKQENEQAEAKADSFKKINDNF